MNKVVADTNVWIAYFRDIPAAVQGLRDKIIESRVVIPTVVAAEFWIKATNDQREVFESIMQGNEIVDLSWEIAKKAAEYRARLIRKQKRVLLLDCVVVAIAREVGAKVLTFDNKDYHLSGVKIKVLEY